MLTKEQKTYIKDQMEKTAMPKERRMGFVRWMIGIYKCDPMAPWPEEGKA